MGEVTLTAHRTLCHPEATLSSPSTHACTLMHKVQVVPLETLPSLRSLSSVQFLASPWDEHKPWQQHSTSLVPKMGLCFSPRAPTLLKIHMWPKVERNDWDPGVVGTMGFACVLVEKEQPWYLRRKESVSPQVFSLAVQQAQHQS